MLFINPVTRATDSNSNSLSGAKLYFYLTGTLTLESVYSSAALTTPLANPVVANAGGLFAPIFLDPTIEYRVILKDASDALIQDIDPYNGATSFAGPGAAFATIPTLKAPEGTTIIQTAGYAADDGVGMARYVYDATVDSAYVAQYPTASTLSSNGRGFRLAEANLTPEMFGTAGGTGFLNAAAYAASRGLSVPFLQPVTKPSVSGQYTLPSGFNDQLGSSNIIFDGAEWRFERSRYNALDFTNWLTVTNYYVDYLLGADANAGTTSGTAFKTFDKALSAVAALGAGSGAVIHCLNDYVGYLSETSISGAINDHSAPNARYVKVVGAGPSGLTRFLAMREDKDQATFAWAAHGSNGAWKSNVAGAVGQWAAQFFLSDLDGNGLPRPVISTGQSAATVSAATGDTAVSYYDGTWLYVHLPNGAKPNPFVNWIYCNNAGDRQYKMDSGTLLFENCEFMAGSVGAGTNSFRFRALSGVTLVTTARLGFKNCGFYGASANGLGVFDPAILVTEQCYGGYCFNDIFNVHSFNSTVAKGAAITWYGDRCVGHDAGYTGFAWGLTASGSDNAFTGHDGSSAALPGCRAWNIKDAAFAFVGGADVAMYGCVSPPNGTGVGSFYNSSTVYEANTGEGTNRRLTMVGCSATASTGSYALQISGTATDAKILISDWQGAADAPLLAWNPNVPAVAGGSIRALADDSLLYAAT